MGVRGHSHTRKFYTHFQILTRLPRTNRTHLILLDAIAVVNLKEFIKQSLSVLAIITCTFRLQNLCIMTALGEVHVRSAGPTMNAI